MFIQVWIVFILRSSQTIFTYVMLFSQGEMWTVVISETKDKTNNFANASLTWAL